MDLEIAREGLLSEIEEGLLIVASGYSIDRTSSTLEQLSRCFQGVAICRLLESGDLVKYRENLTRSAYARRFFLRKSREQRNIADRRLALSRTEGFFDALAAGNGLLAREIAALSDNTWHEGWEYKDDHDYFAFLHQVVMEPASVGRDDLRALLHEYERALDGDEPPRLAVLRSIAERDQATFNAALRALMEELDEQMQKRKDRLLDPSLEAYLLWPRSFVCVEGLALVAIATALRMQVEELIPLCPTAARLPISAVLVEDPFVGIEARLAPGGR
jgi:Immunity protein 49